MSSLREAIQAQQASTENALTIVYQPQAIFRVRPVTRCMSDLPGHSEAVLAVAFSPCGSMLASGSGDTTVRIWDLFTNTPQFTCKGHKNWVFTIAWSPNSKHLASAGMDNEIRVWDPKTGRPNSAPLKGHTAYVTCLAWEPLNANPACEHLASGSKDNTIRVWNLRQQACVRTLSGHSHPVTAIRWGGAGLLYSASRDRTIKVWDPLQGTLVRTLEGHAHWVTTLSLSTDHALRTGAFDRHGMIGDGSGDDGGAAAAAADEADPKTVQAAAQAKYDKIIGKGSEMLVSGSDDFTLFLWDPVKSKKPVQRLTGHQQPITQVSFSPDGNTIASCSFDKSVKLWAGASGKYINSLRSHVEAVYQVAWSGDSRLVVSASKDSTIKVWEARTQKRLFELPGHADEVYAVDWAPDGDRVVSGSKDRIMKMWSK